MVYPPILAKVTGYLFYFGDHLIPTCWVPQFSRYFLVSYAPHSRCERRANQQTSCISGCLFSAGTRFEIKVSAPLPFFPTCSTVLITLLPVSHSMIDIDQIDLDSNGGGVLNRRSGTKAWHQGIPDPLSSAETAAVRSVHGDGVSGHALLELEAQPYPGCRYCREGVVFRENVNKSHACATTWEHRP